MKQIVKQYDDMNNVFGKPQPYSVIRDDKIHTVYLHPLKLIDYKLYQEFIPKLTINKNTLGLQEALCSSYLKFLLFIMPEIKVENQTDDDKIIDEVLKNREVFFNFFIDLLCHVLCIEPDSIRVEYLTEDREFNRWKIYFFIDGVKFTENDFTKMVDIILIQNGVQRPSFEIYDAELQKELDEASEWMSSQGNYANLNEQIFAYHVATSVPFSEIEQYTFYQFNKAIERASILKDYEVLRPLEASGQIELKNGSIDHWLTHRSNDNKYGGVTSNKSTLTNMLGDVSVMN